MDRRAAQQNSGSVPPSQSSAAPPPPPSMSTAPPPPSTAPPPSTVPPPPSTAASSPSAIPSPSSASSAVALSTGISPSLPPASSSAPATSGSSVALPISSSSVTRQSTHTAGSSVVATVSSTTDRGTVPRGPSDLPSSSGTATINSIDDKEWADIVIAITWGSIGGIILLAIGILVWRNRHRHDKEDHIVEPETYHPPVLRHPPRPAVPSGQYALSAALLENIQAQEDLRQEQEAAMGFHVPLGQPGSRFSVVSQDGSTLAAPPTLMYMSLPPNSDLIPATGSGPRPMLHRMASAPVMIRPLSFVGSATSATGTPTNNPVALSPVSDMSADSSPYPQTSMVYRVPVYMIPVSSSAGQMNPSFAYATTNRQPDRADGIQHAQTLPLNAGKPHDSDSELTETSADGSEKEQGALIPEGDNVQQRPTAENVRHRQTGGSPQSATFAEGYLPHSSSTFSLNED